MSKKIKGLFLLVCAVAAILLAVFFYSHTEKIEANVPLVTPEMVANYQKESQANAEKQQRAEEARQRNETQLRMVTCQTSEQCIIVDKDPCGCLSGPAGVTAINADYSLEFSRLIEKEFAEAKTCPSVGSTERECSASARAVCQENRCKIIY